MNILVTGGAGYIGSVFVSRLWKGDYIRVLDNLMYGGESLLPVFNNIDFVHGDIRDCDKSIFDDIDFVVHLAALVGETACKKNPDLAVETNLEATKRLFRLAEESGVSFFIFASTCSNYGKALLATEETDLNPLGLYAQTKVDAERFILSQESEMVSMILRFATAYGISPRMRWDLLINQFVLDAYTKGKLDIYNPLVKRPFAHVDDIARAIWYIAGFVRQVQKGNIFNIGGHNRSKLELVNQIKDVLPTETTFTETGTGRDYNVDFSKLANIGFYVLETPEKGIRECLSLLKANLINPLDERWTNDTTHRT